MWNVSMSTAVGAWPSYFIEMAMPSLPWINTRNLLQRNALLFALNNQCLTRFTVLLFESDTPTSKNKNGSFSSTQPIPPWGSPPNLSKFNPRVSHRERAGDLLPDPCNRNASWGIWPGLRSNCRMMAAQIAPNQMRSGGFMHRKQHFLDKNVRIICWYASTDVAPINI